MEEMPQNSDQLNEIEEEKFGHSDSIVGLFTEPAATFQKMSLYPPKAVDWLIPSILLVIVAIFANIIMFRNAQIKYSVIEKQMTINEKYFQELVAKGKMSPRDAEEKLENSRAMMEKTMGGLNPMMIVSTIIGVFVKFFIVAGVFFVIVRFILKGQGSYSSSMVALGLPAYISVLQVIFMVVAALLMSRFLDGLSITSFLDLDKSTYAGFFLSFIDPFSIWFYSIVGVGYAKMFKSEKTVVYVGTIFGLWIGFSTILFVLAKFIPMLKMFGL